MLVLPDLRRFSVDALRTHRLWFFITILAVEPWFDQSIRISIRSLIMSLFVSLELSGNGSRRITCGFPVRYVTPFDLTIESLWASLRR